jgi:hypothetical protein
LKYPRAFSSLNIEEMTVTGNLPIKKMLARKIKWNTVDDDKLTESSFDDEQTDIKTLKPM